MATKEKQIMKEAGILHAKIKDIIEDLNEHHRNVTIAKTTGTAASVAGGVAVAAGFLLAPFTFGASVAVGLAGAGVAAAGGLVTAGAEVTETIITNNNVKQVQEDLESLQSKTKEYEALCEILEEDDDLFQELKKLGKAGKTGAKTAYRIIKAVRAAKAARAAGTSVAVAAGSAGAKLLSKSFVALNVILLPLNIYDLVKSSVALAENEDSPASADLEKLCRKLKEIKKGKF
nr:hypothetical protein BaRGS_013271 [Batillaria attramentaria]